MEWIYSFMERFTGEALLPRGGLRSSAKRALSLLLLLYAAEPILKLLEKG